MTGAAQAADAVIRPPASWVGPIPADEEWTAQYWESLRRHELSIQRCTQCRAWQHPPVIACPACGSDELAFELVTGRGTIYSVTVCYREFGLQFGVPWIAAYVQLDEGPRVATDLINVSADDESITIGLPVSVVYHDYDEIDLTLAFFEPAGAHS